MKTLLFVIDMQNDFCLPNGSLYVPGAEADVTRLCNLLQKKHAVITGIILTQDNHQLVDIAHPAFWHDAQGEHPKPFTSISANDVEQDKWIPFCDKSTALSYLQQLEAQGEYSHTIWPEHCIWGSEGAAIVSPFMKELAAWARQGHYFEIVSKGSYPLTEHFGAFRANIPINNVPETQLNITLIQTLNNYEQIWIAGEARTHCVANTIKQLFEYPDIVKKLVILEDCMSNIPGFENIAKPIFEQAQQLGARLTTSDKL